MVCLIEGLLRPSATYKHKLAVFCEPLERHFGINHFYYHRVTDDGNLFLIGNNMPWLEVYCEGGLYLKNPFYRASSNFESGMHLVHDLKNEDWLKIIARAKTSGVHPYMQFMKKKGTVVETYGLGLSSSARGHQARTLDELVLLQQFFVTFSEQFRDVVAKAENLQVEIGQQIGSKFYNGSEKILNSKIDKKAFLSEISSPLVKLSNQERQVFLRWTNGFSAKEVALQMGLSPRTVEHYITTIKYKLDFSSRGEAVERFNMNSVFGLIE